MTASDLDLLKQFARDNSQDAFGEIIRRHVDLVYTAALRQVRSPQLAEEVAQSVFSDLARNAGKLKPDTVLTAWLYAVTRRTAVDVIRKESRRQLREQIAMEMNTMNATSNDWNEIGPLLDDAMAALDETDRSVILLRYFDNKSLREVGESLKISDDAAQKRAARAVERLREFFSKRNVTVGASGLAVLLAANAVQAAPAGMAATISAAAILSGAAFTATAATTTTKVIAMTTLQKAIIGVALAAAIGTGAFQAHKASQLHAQNEALQQRMAPLAAQIRQLQMSLSDATNQIAGLTEENAQLESKSNEDELLKLRNEVTLLRREVKDQKPDPAPVVVSSTWANWNNSQNLGSFYSIAATPSETVAVGIGGHIATRDNSSGVWKVQVMSEGRDFRGVVYADGQYVAVSEGGYIMTSPDGIQWTRRDSPTRKNLLGVFWDGHQYLAGGDGGTILASSDGINWESRYHENGISIYSFSYSGTRYIAVGNDAVRVSDDSITWTKPDSAPSDIIFTASVWAGNEFLACGISLGNTVPTIYTSPDGESWTLRDSTIMASLRTALSYNNAIYVSGDSVIEKSMDGGTTWTNVFDWNGKGNRLFMGLTSDGQHLIAAGFNHNVWAAPLAP